MLVKSYNSGSYLHRNVFCILKNEFYSTSNKSEEIKRKLKDQLDKMKQETLARHNLNTIDNNKPPTSIETPLSLRQTEQVSNIAEKLKAFIKSTPKTTEKIELTKTGGPQASTSNRNTSLQLTEKMIVNPSIRLKRSESEKLSPEVSNALTDLPQRNEKTRPDPSRQIPKETVHFKNIETTPSSPFSTWSDALDRESGNRADHTSNHQRLSQYRPFCIIKKNTHKSFMRSTHERDDFIPLMQQMSLDLEKIIEQGVSRDPDYHHRLAKALNRYDFTVLEELFDLPPLSTRVTSLLTRQVLSKLREFQMPVLPSQIEASLCKEFDAYIVATNWNNCHEMNSSHAKASVLIKEKILYDKNKSKLELGIVKEKSATKASNEKNINLSNKGKSTAKTSIVDKEVMKNQRSGLLTLDDPEACQSKRIEILAETELMMKEISSGDYKRYGNPQYLLSKAKLTPFKHTIPINSALKTAAKALALNSSMHPSMKVDTLNIIQEVLSIGNKPSSTHASPGL